MTISSRTPEGWPCRCPICEQVARLEISLTGDACCLSCGHLLWWFRDRLSQPQLDWETPYSEALGPDSLDQVETVMALEEKFNVHISEADAEQIRTLRDAIRFIQQHRKS